MSLLLDALKRAEQAKRDSSLALEPLDSDNRTPSPAPNFPLGGVTPGPTLGSPARRAEQAAAARTPTAAKPLTVQNRPLWLLLGGLALLAMGAGVFWLWYMMSFPASQAPMISPNMASQPRPMPPPPAAPAEALAINAPTNPGGTNESPSPATTQPAATSKPKLVSSKAQVGSVPATVAAGASPVAAPGLQLKPSIREKPTVSPELTSAYQALTRGDYVTAKHDYLLVIRDDPFNIDAFLGLATTAALTGDLAAAQMHYRKALEIDPKNPIAQAGLATVQMNENPSMSESQLRAQIAVQPHAPPPYSALGHVYAAQGKWGDAQQAFFEAYRLAPSDPDHAFNLAVSLDHLGQSKLAREYYGKALSLAASRSAGFNSVDVTTRINQLAP